MMIEGSMEIRAVPSTSCHGETDYILLDHAGVIACNGRRFRDPQDAYDAAIAEMERAATSAPSPAPRTE